MVTEQQKTGCIVVGPESSGSVFVAKVVSHVLGHCQEFGDWNGYGFNDKIGADKLVLHRSVPYDRPKKFPTSAAELLEPFQGYDDVKIVLTSRDRTISMSSKIRRFGGGISQARLDLATARPLFAELLDRDDVLVWNYETMVLFGQPYFNRLYRFLGVESDFRPDVVDANNKYVGGRTSGLRRMLSW